VCPERIEGARVPAPKVIGPYEIVELLGRGGMGEVYKAVDTRMYRRPVALKLISEAMGADPRALSKFDQEVETAANLRHPNIVQIYDRGEHEGRRYFTMEFLEGRDLTEVIKERELSPLDSRLDIIVQICDALDYAHAHGVVHRDIKPANIRVITRGGTDHVKVIDFGIAHVDRSTHTRTVVQPGTTLYMSPEQLNDEQVSPKSDLFSVGIVAYELCSGVHPFKARTEFLTGSNIMREKQTPLRSMDPSAPEALETLLERLLEKDRDHRPASAAAVSVELKSITRQLRTASSDGERAFFGNLDEMTGPMVERIVHWAKGKEQSGAIVEAIEAYKRAILLAPNAPWLHARVASLEEQLKRAPELDVQPEDDPSLRTSSRNRHREAFVRESMVEAGAALDDGELDQASSIAAAILRQYPDEPAALALMDQIVVIIDRGLELKPYRQALRAAREALARDDLDGAQRALEAAVAIWPDDHEVITLGQEIEARRQVEMERALEVCDGVLGRASAGTLADDAAPAAVAQAREALRRAEDLGAPAALVGGKRSVLDRILSDALARAEERERKAREVEDARRAEAARLLGEATRMLSAAERATSADAATARAALADVRAALDAIARTESLGADPVETSALRVRSDTASRSLEEHIAREQARDREVAARLDAIRSGLADIERMVAGEVEEALQAEEPLNVAERDLAALAAERPSAKDLPGLRQAADGLRTRIATPRGGRAPKGRGRASRQGSTGAAGARDESSPREGSARTRGGDRTEEGGGEGRAFAHALGRGAHGVQAGGRSRGVDRDRSRPDVTAPRGGARRD
jgi:tRNA A-37 threonylcarbamoyl transferase component Bud32/tetratricopeptide (TPR) repeat protein